MQIRKIIFSIFLVVCILWIPGLLSAQTGVSDEEVDVIRDYNPILADALKINLTAQTPESTAKPEALVYNTNVKYFELPYQPIKIKPIALSKTPEEDLENIYVKVGFGAPLTPLAQVYINSGRSDKLNYGLFANYISTNSTAFKDYSHLNIGGTSNFYLNKNYVIPVNAGFTNDVVYYYGYDTDSLEFDKADVRQRFNAYNFDIAFKNLAENDLNIDYLIQTGVSGKNDINKYGVINPFLRLAADKKLDNDFTAGAELFLDFYNHKAPVHQDNAVTHLILHYGTVTPEYSLLLQLDNAVEKQGRYYALPTIEFSKDLVGDKFVFVAGWDTRLIVNNFNSITNENPFVGDTINYISSVADKKYAGFRGSTNGNFSYSLEGYYKINRNMLFYVNNPFDAKRFDVLYEDATLFGGNVEVDYFNANKFRIMAALDYFSFVELNLEKPWFTPTLNWTLAGTYYFNSKLSATADIFGVNGSYAMLPGEVIEKLKGTVDLNISANYMYSRYFNIFLNINNITSYKYERFYNYPGYGINAIAGISFSF